MSKSKILIKSIPNGDEFSEKIAFESLLFSGRVGRIVVGDVLVDMTVDLVVVDVVVVVIGRGLPLSRYPHNRSFSSDSSTQSIFPSHRTFSSIQAP